MIKFKDALEVVSDPKELKEKIDTYGVTSTAMRYGLNAVMLRRIMAHYGVKQDIKALRQRQSRYIVKGK